MQRDSERERQRERKRGEERERERRKERGIPMWRGLGVAYYRRVDVHREVWTYNVASILIYLQVYVFTFQCSVLHIDT